MSLPYQPQPPRPDQPHPVQHQPQAGPPQPGPPQPGPPQAGRAQAGEPQAGQPPQTQAYGSQPGQGQLVVNMRKPFGPFSAALMSPNLRIDGFPAPTRWERNGYPVVTGRHQVRASTNYMWEFGAAEMPVDIWPGQTVEVHYSPPLITFIAGRIGFEQQPRPGMVAFWIVLAIPVVILLVVFLGILVSSLGS